MAGVPKSPCNSFAGSSCKVQHQKRACDEGWWELISFPRASLTDIPLLPTGIFTAPVSGRYMVSAILTGHRGEKIEAVLSRSNQAIARSDSAGFQPEGLENKPVADSQPSTGAVAVFTLVVPMEAGETLCVDLVSGRLARSPDEPLTVFSAALLYEEGDED